MGKFGDVIQQVELFIKKYYKNEMIRGGLIFLAFLLLSYTTVAVLEHFGRFSSGIRLSLLITFVLVNGWLLFRYLIIPVLRLNKLGRHLSIMDAADMIGRFFPDVRDKLKNTIQLEKDSVNYSFNLELVRASVEQRAAQLSVISFNSAIDLSENRKYLKYLIPIIGSMIILGAVYPALFLESTERVIHFNQEYVEPAPFSFKLSSDGKVKEGEDYLLEINLEGNDLPDEVKIVSNNGTYNLNKISKTRFQYQFTNVRNDIQFYCEGNGFKSENFVVDVLYKPVLEDIQLHVVYPAHTGIKAADFNNAGDLSVPEGSTIKWSVTAKNLTKLDVFFKDTLVSLKTNLANTYSFQRRFLESESYALVTSSDEVENADSLGYDITVIKDEYPQISVEEEIDSMNSLRRYVEGSISDDYGFRGLAAKMKVIKQDSSYTVSKSIKINQKSLNQLFSFYIDLSPFNLGPGDRIEYSFVVTDNDEINGYKSTVSSRKIFEVPDLDELENNLSAQSDKIEKDINQLKEQSDQLQKEIQDLRNDLMNKQNPDWKDKQNLENLLNLHQQLSQQIEQMQMEYEKNNTERENYLEEDPELEEKRKQLEELMNQLMDEELLDLLKELEELMNQMDKEKIVQNLDQMEQESENLSEELDRTLELFKMMEIDEKLKSLEQQLRDLAEEQEKLNEMTENKELSPEELSQKQEELNKKFDEIQKDMDEIEQKNSELKNPMDIDFNEEQEEGIDQEMNESKEYLDNNNSKKSQENQSKASEMLKQMADDVSAMQMQMSEQQQAEDMEALRYLLENLVALSHRQEALMKEFKVTAPTDPKYGELSQEQLDINVATQIVNDSLIALSQRVFQLSSFINEELADLNYNLDNSLNYAEERKTNETIQSQQYVMTGYNDLALMLAEVLDQMQQQAQMKMPGNGSCNNPGGAGQGKSGKMTMEQMKQALQQQIDQMKGPNPGGKEPGESEGPGGGEQPGSIPGLSNKQIVKMAAEQSLIRESLMKLREELNEDGSGAGNGLNELIEEIDQLEKDLLNGNIGPDFIQRQQDILTRLLEHEKAMRERGFSEERESNEGKNPENGNLIEFTEYNRKKDAEAEFLRTFPISLQVYYKALVNEYFNSVNE